jgi:hypothetical protein
MDSNALKNKVSSANQPLKARAVLTGSTGATVTYFCRPSVLSKLLGAKFTVITKGTNSSKYIKITKTTITDPDLIPDNITISTNISDSAVATSEVFTYAIPDNATTTTAWQPGANITDALLTCDPTTTGNAVKVIIDKLTNPVIGVLVLEFLPI